MVLLPVLVLISCGCSTDVSDPVGANVPAAESEHTANVANVSEVGQVDDRTQPVDQGAAVASIKNAHKKAYDEYRAASAAAKSAEEKQELKHPLIENYAANMMAAIELDVESSEAFEGLLWLYEKTKRKDKKTADDYLDIMMEHHVEREKIGGVASWIAYADKSSKTERNLLKILENNKHQMDLATTVLSLIKHYQAIKAIQTDAVTRGYAEKNLGAEGMKYVDSRTREELNLLIDKYFAIGLEEYGELSYGRGTFAERLQPHLFVHERLQIGMQVPDIVGEDIDGIEFKLSDYRGKVVMIDFWGDW